jgi:hypothetical protein
VVVKIVGNAQSVAASPRVIRRSGAIALTLESKVTPPSATGAAAPFVRVSLPGATVPRPGPDPAIAVDARVASGERGPVTLKTSALATVRVDAAGGNPVPPSVDPISARAVSASVPPREITFATVDATTGAATVAASPLTVATEDAAMFVTAFATGAAALATGATAFTTVAAALFTGAVAFVTGAATFVTGAAAFVTGAAAFVTGAAAFVTGAATFVTGAAAFVTGAAAFVTGAAAFVTGAAVFVTGAAALFTGAVAVETGAGALTGADCVDEAAGFGAGAGTAGALCVVCVGVDDEVGAATGTEDVTGAVDVDTVLVVGAADVAAGWAAVTVDAWVTGTCARATPASAAKQTMTPATRIDRIRIRARVDTGFLFSASKLT